MDDAGHWMGRSKPRAFFDEPEGSEPAAWMRPPKPPRSPRSRWMERAQVAGLVVLVAVLLSFPVVIGYATWMGRRSDVDQWKIAGPPCAEVATISRIAAPPKRGPMSFVYAGAKFSRSYGSASCATIPEDGLMTRATYHVCQFSNPGAVTVAVGARRVIFEPPVGRRATVTLRRGRLGCVVAGWFNG
jgi:hypothetical protein